MGRRKNNNFIHIALAVILITIFSVVGYELNIKIEKNYNLNTQVNNNVENVINTNIVENSSNLKIHYIDQTTTNMIQRISHLFAINPLISKEI